MNWKELINGNALMTLNRLDMSFGREYLPESLMGMFEDKSGKEHYRLLYELCAGKSLAFDIGTYKGSSAVAMSSAKKVISYDVEKLTEAKKPKNVTFKIGDAIDDEKLLNADIIMVDVYHDGVYETDIYDFLDREGFKGVVLFDDIQLNGDMIRFWGSIKRPKHMLTGIGHYTGTGLVDFSQTKKDCSNCG